VVHAVGVEPAVLVLDVGHEHRLAAREGQADDPSIGRQLELRIRLGAGAPGRARHEPVDFGVVQQNPGCARAEQPFDDVQHGRAHLLHVQPVRKGHRRVDERLLADSEIERHAPVRYKHCTPAGGAGVPAAASF
jgi:hypothetical protein